MRVLTAGSETASQRARTCLCAPAAIAPPPTQSSGRLAARIASATRLHLHGMTPEAGLIAPDRGLLRVAEIDQLPLDVDGHVDQHRPAPPGRRDVKRLLEDARDVGSVPHEVAVFGERLRRARGVDLLEDVAAQKPRLHLPGDRDERDAVGIGRGDRGEEVGRAGAGGGDADGGLPGDAGVAARGVAGVLFIAGEDVPDGRLPEAVVKRADRRAGIPEYHGNPLRLKTFHHRLRAADHLHPPFLSELSLLAIIRACALLRQCVGTDLRVFKIGACSIKACCYTGSNGTVKNQTGGFLWTSATQ